MPEPLITDHTYRAAQWTGSRDVRERDRCAWLGTCNRPEAEHAASTWPKFGPRAKRLWPQDGAEDVEIVVTP